jgi:redox-regulated HSP33 family molecular chaperone
MLDRCFDKDGGRVAAVRYRCECREKDKRMVGTLERMGNMESENVFEKGKRVEKCNILTFNIVRKRKERKSEKRKI